MANDISSWISEIVLPSGSKYYIKDALARDQISSISSSIQGGVHYIGKTTTEIEDGATTSPSVVINGKTVTAVQGDMVSKANSLSSGQDLEFIYNGTTWYELGSTGSLKALAFKDNASASYTPAGSVSQPTFTGSTTTSTGKFTPTGSVSKPTFTGTEGNVSVTGTTNVTASLSTATTKLTANVTATGNIISATDGTAFKPSGGITLSGVPSATVSYNQITSITYNHVTALSSSSKNADTTVTINEISSGNYQPKGTINTPEITIGTKTAATSADIKVLPSGATNILTSFTAGQLPALTASVSEETLTLNFYAGTQSTAEQLTATTTKVVTAPPVLSAKSNNLTFTGTKVQLAGTTQISTYTVITADATVTDNNIKTKSSTLIATVGLNTLGATFEGDDIKLKFSGTQTSADVQSFSLPTDVNVTNSTVTSTGKFTPDGSVSQPEFTGTQGDVSVTGTPSGTVSTPEFTGTSAEITVS